MHNLTQECAYHVTRLGRGEEQYLTFDFFVKGTEKKDILSKIKEYSERIWRVQSSSHKICFLFVM